MNVHNSCIGKIDRILWFNTFFHSLLVSGSDDLNAILWDPLQCQKKCCIKTGHSGNIFSVKVSFYYMTSSMSRQDEPNLVLWLATQAGKIELSCPLGIWALSHKENLSCFGVVSHIISPLLTKVVQSRWLNIGLVVFFACLWKKELGQYPAILTSRLVYTPYILHLN